MNNLFKKMVIASMAITFFSKYTFAKDIIRIGVASNFHHTLKNIVKDYGKISSTKIILTPGSSGKLFAQIKNGAPYDIFFSADTRFPKRLSEIGLADGQSYYIYARGEIVLWSKDTFKSANYREVLLRDNALISLANPKIAPYGSAALEIINKHPMKENLQKRLIYGENVSQALHFSIHGNAKYAFIPFSLYKQLGSGHILKIEKELYSPIEQAVVIISKKTKKNEKQELIKFLNFIKKDNIVNLIKSSGYQ